MSIRPFDLVLDLDLSRFAADGAALVHPTEPGDIKDLERLEEIYPELVPYSGYGLVYAWQEYAQAVQWCRSGPETYEADFIGFLLRSTEGFDFGEMYHRVDWEELLRDASRAYGKTLAEVQEHQQARRDANRSTKGEEGGGPEQELKRAGIDT